MQYFFRFTLHAEHDPNKRYGFYLIDSSLIRGHANYRFFEESLPELPGNKLVFQVKYAIGNVYSEEPLVIHTHLSLFLEFVHF